MWYKWLHNFTPLLRATWTINNIVVLPFIWWFSIKESIHNVKTDCGNVWKKSTSSKIYSRKRKRWEFNKCKVYLNYYNKFALWKKFLQFSTRYKILVPQNLPNIYYTYWEQHINNISTFTEFNIFSKTSLLGCFVCHASSCYACFPQLPELQQAPR